MSSARDKTISIPISRGWTERLALALVWLAALIVSSSFLCILGDLAWHGVGGVSWNFLREDPSSAGRVGGILPILVSTLWILAIAMAAAVPLGLGAAVWMAEFARQESRLAAWVGASLDVLAAVPSIVFGLFGNALFCTWLGMGYSLLAGGLTVACMVLPILIRALYAGFRAVPDDYRLAGAALGISKTRLVVSVLFPAATTGLTVGLVLGVGRVLAETAALLFTSGYVDRMPRSLLDSGRTLSIHIYDLSMNVPGGEPNAYASAVVLVGLLLVINYVAVWTADRWLRSLTSAPR